MEIYYMYQEIEFEQISAIIHTPVQIFGQAFATIWACLKQQFGQACATIWACLKQLFGQDCEAF